jgi:uncharacterized protein (TIGR02246 family)
MLPLGGALALLAFAGLETREPAPASAGVLEVRSYNLKPGTREAFHALVEHEALPLLRRFGIDVVAYGPSLHDSDSYFLMRAFASPEARERAEDTFYGSAAWKGGPREAVLAAIASFTTVVIRVDAATLGGLRMTTNEAPAASADLAALVRLNDDYIQSVKSSDVARFREILAEDFLCTLADGTLIDRRQFLEHTAAPYTLRGLQAHDLNVRLLGDFAIVHARTTFTLPDGTPGSGRYTDVWARRDGRWLAIAAHVTRK